MHIGVSGFLKVAYTQNFFIELNILKSNFALRFSKDDDIQMVKMVEIVPGWIYCHISRVEAKEKKYSS